MADGQNTPRPKKKPKRRRGRRERSLAGTNLFREARTDVLIWRRVHPITGKRVKRNTKTTADPPRPRGDPHDHLRQAGVGVREHSVEGPAREAEPVTDFVDRQVGVGLHDPIMRTRGTRPPETRQA